MALAFELYLAINGELTDTTVENDTALWATKCGNVKINGGGGSWWRTSEPSKARLDILIPARLAHKVRTVTIAVKSAATLTGTIPTGTIGSSYRIVFHGDVQSIRATADPNGAVEIDAVDEMSGLMNRRARTAASPNTGIRALLTDIETAHTLTMNGGTTFPSSADFPNLDRPAQKGISNGVWLRTALAGTGINMAAEWETSITAPALMWRPDYFDTLYSASVATTRQWTWEAVHPWSYVYTDIGIQWQDFIARVNLDGENAAGTQYYGWAKLSDTAVRAKLAQRENNQTTWMDNAADLQKYARRLLAHVGEPNWLKINQVTLPIEKLYSLYLSEGFVDADIEAFTAAAMMPGDQIDWRDPFDNTNALAPDWPAVAPDGGDLYDNLLALWYVTVEDNGVTNASGRHIIRSITREWTPNGGWFVTYGLDPYSQLTGTDIASNGSGTY